MLQDWQNTGRKYFLYCQFSPHPPFFSLPFFCSVCFILSRLQAQEWEENMSGTKKKLLSCRWEHTEGLWLGKCSTSCIDNSFGLSFTSWLCLLNLKHSPLYNFFYLTSINQRRIQTLKKSKRVFAINYIFICSSKYNNWLTKHHLYYRIYFALFLCIYLPILKNFKLVYFNISGLFCEYDLLISVQKMGAITELFHNF